MNFETILFAVAFFLLAIFTQPRNDIIFTDRAEFEKNSDTIAAVIASKDDDVSAVTELEAGAEIANAQNE